MAKKPSEKSRELYRYLKVHFSEEFAIAITKYLSTDFTAGRMLRYIKNTGNCSMEMIVDEMLAILNLRVILHFLLERMDPVNPHCWMHLL